MGQLSQRNEPTPGSEGLPAREYLRARSAPTPPCQAAAIRSEQIFAGRQRVTIVHGGGLYQLQQTRQGKLILTK
jgi:hemin uptake protein HemP